MNGELNCKSIFSSFYDTRYDLLSSVTCIPARKVLLWWFPVVLLVICGWLSGVCVLSTTALKIPTPTPHVLVPAIFLARQPAAANRTTRCKKNSGHSLVGLRTLPAMTRLSPNDLFMSLLKPHDQTATVLFKPLRANTSTTICYDYHQAMNLLLDTRPYRHHYGQIDWFNQIINNKVIAREFI